MNDIKRDLEGFIRKTTGDAVLGKERKPGDVIKDGLDFGILRLKTADEIQACKFKSDAPCRCGPDTLVCYALVKPEKMQEEDSEGVRIYERRGKGNFVGFCKRRTRSESGPGDV